MNRLFSERKPRQRPVARKTLHHRDLERSKVGQASSPEIDKGIRGLHKRDFERLANFRYQIRCFERFSDEAAQREGITSLQHLLLLHLKGFPGRERATVGEIAERLQAKHHSTVTLVSRCEALGLVARHASESDRRCVEVSLLPAGEELLAWLKETHQRQLRKLASAFDVPQLGL
jgi:DNA-binding MarR family transcriptional regulator